MLLFDHKCGRDPIFFENVNFDDLIAIGVTAAASDRGSDRAFSKSCSQCHFVNNFL